MVFGFSITKLRFNGGDEVPLQPGSMLILVGPNNGGKSTALRDMQQSLAAPASNRVVLDSVETAAEGSADDFDQWVRTHFPLKSPGPGNPLQFATRGAWVPEEQVKGSWENGSFRQTMASFLVNLLGTEDRLTLTKWGPSANLVTHPPERYIHVMQANDTLDRSVRAQIKAAFGQDLLIHRGAGQQVGFHVGAEPPTGGGVDRVSESYLTALNQLPKLDDQGDGLRSYVGSILAAFCGSQPILLIDEPEAFLHPPQARRLATALASTAVSAGRQIVVATHSADVVEGAVVSGVSVTVCRVTRDGAENHARKLDPADLKQLWANPLLRSAAAIDGMFHDGVVICESDADCRLYEAMVRRIESSGRLTRVPDLFFTHGGGKGALAALASAYGALDVDRRVIADLDLLRNVTELRRTAEGLGMDWPSIERPATSAVRNLVDIAPLLTDKQFRERLAQLLRDADQNKTDIRRDVAKVAADAADWSDVKRYGISKLRSKPLQEAEDFLRTLRSGGLFLVPVGELEGWYPGGSTDKPKWFIEAMVELDRVPDSLPALEQFVLTLLASFGYLD